MAKTRNNTPRGDTDLAKNTPDLTAKVKKAVMAIKAKFTTFTKNFAALSVSREELAPQFMKAANLWMAETKGTFVDFVRFLDPNVGNTRDEYRSHRSYQAADYLRRLVANSARRDRTGDEEAPRAAAPTDAIASILGSLLEIIPEDRHQQVYDALQERMGWSERQVTRMQTQVEHVDPLVHIRAKVENLRLSFPTGEEAAEQEREAA